MASACPGYAQVSPIKHVRRNTHRSSATPIHRRTGLYGHYNPFSLGLNSALTSSAPPFFPGFIGAGLGPGLSDTRQPGHANHGHHHHGQHQHKIIDETEVVGEGWEVRRRADTDVSHYSECCNSFIPFAFLLPPLFSLLTEFQL